MAEETITILKVGTEEAVRNIQDLKENVSTLKKSLETLDVGTEEYADTLNELRVNQNALKDAMYATSASMEDVAASATGTSDSYNSLVHRMAALKEEFRSTTDILRRHELGQEINNINTQLKEMDALQGNFQRNVGNYTNSIKDAFKGLSEKTDAFGKSLNIANGGVGGFKDIFEALGKSPAIATFGILVTMVMKLADQLKDNETAMAAVKKAMTSLKPVMDFFSGVVEKLATFLADIIGKAATFVTSNGIFQKVADGLAGIGNAIVKFVVSPFKAVAAAIKTFQDEGIKGIGKAAKAFGQEMKSGVAFKSNYQAGEVLGETIIAGATSKKPEIKEAGVEIGKDMGEGIKEGVEEKLVDVDKILSDVEKRQSDYDKLWSDEEKAVTDEITSEYDATLAEIEEFFDAQAALREQDLMDAQAKTQAKKDLLYGVADCTASIISSIADIYEADEENSEKNAKKIRALRIAVATMDTISGAISAFMQGVSAYPPPYGIIFGAAQAAAVTAAGFAQIASLKAVSTSGSSSSSVSASTSASAVTAAPAVTTDVTNVRSVTSASEEERLNQMASDQKVYILSSDIEASLTSSKTKVQESSF